MTKDNHISIIWDFDGTLASADSTGITIEYLTDKHPNNFWETVHSLSHKTNNSKKDDSRDAIESVLASDAPVWMFALSRIAFLKNIPLNKEFFREFIAPKIQLFPEVTSCIEWLNSFSEKEDFKRQNLKVKNFIVSAGLRDLIAEVFEKNVFEGIFGCRYEVGYMDPENQTNFENIPVFCMDETMKTRAIFDISKGTFKDTSKKVNKRMVSSELWCPFENIIYVGDGPTDIPALSLVRDRGGSGVVVYDPSEKREDTKKNLKEMSLDKRADIITPANFNPESELREFLKARIVQILQRYRSANLSSII